jgi:hypothetical protein
MGMRRTTGGYEFVVLTHSGDPWIAGSPCHAEVLIEYTDLAVSVTACGPHEFLDATTCLVLYVVTDSQGCDEVLASKVPFTDFVALTGRNTMASTPSSTKT